VTAPAGWAAWRQALIERLGGPSPLAVPVVLRKARLVLVDDLAAMIAAAGHVETVALAAHLRREEAAGEATVIAGGRASRELAAAANAVAASWDEIDEGYRPATCHGGLYTLPAALAEVEATGVSLDDLLEAVVIGYEVVTAVARALPAPRPLILHPHATLSPLGAAAAVAWLRTRDPDFVVASVDVAATMAFTGSFRHATQGLQARNAWAGAGALIGFFAVDATASGLLSDDRALLEVYRDTFGQVPDAEELNARPESDHWAILDGYHKPYAACQYTHAALEACAELVAVHGCFDPSAIEEVLVDTHPLALALDATQPTTTLGGKFSVPHVVASVLVRGSVGLAAFNAAGLTDPSIAALRPRIQLRPYLPLPAAPHDRPARVVIRLVGGRRLEASCLSATGGPDRPLSTEDVLAKVVTVTTPSVPGFGALARSLVHGHLDGTAEWGGLLEKMLNR
jgi:2-methylcitrate dehydratase PrpD